MQLVTKYLKKHLIANFLIMLLFFAVLSSVMQFVSQMKSLGEGNYHMASALSYVLLLLPRNLYKLSPIIITLTIAYSAFKLVNTKELIAIGAAGVPVKEMLRSLARMGGLIVLLFFILGEGFGPWCANAAKNNRMNAILGGKALAQNSSIWLHEDNWYVHIDNVIDASNFEGVTRYLAHKGELKRVEYAKSAHYENSSWLLQDVLWTDISDSKISSGSKDKIAWESELDSSIITNFNVMPVRQTLWGLGYMLSADLDMGSSTSKYVFWQRLFYPVSLFFMLYFVLMVFFSSTKYNRHKNSFIVSVCVLFYYFAPDYLLSFSLYNFPPMLSALLLPALTMGICYMFMRKNMLD